jgi:hypothetical protein
MPDPISSQCTPIANEIGELEAEKAGLQQELAEASPSLKPFYIREIRKINLELARKRQDLRECLQQNPPPPRPDLVAQTVLLNVNHATRELGVAALIRNDGTGNARGPFRIDLAATLIKDGVTTSFVHVFEVPAGITIFGKPELEQPGVVAIPGGVTPSREYVTERMIVPLCYRDENPSCVYEFEFIVDAEQVVAETNEGNNHFFARWWTTTPAAAQRDTPFVIEPLEAP